MTLINNILRDLKKHIDLPYKKGSEIVFKGPDQTRRCLGVRVPNIRKIGKTYYKQISHLSKKEVFEICEQLLEKKYMETHIIAFAWAFAKKSEYELSDFARFERWIKNYVHNWATCDDFCTHAMGSLIHMYPELIEKTKKWRSSKNRWLRRAAAVSLIYPIKKQNILNDIFSCADELLMDEDDLVQKGYGWMLKVASSQYYNEVFKYVLKHKKNMPRTALRYAIEKYPKEMRKHAMS